MTPDRATGAPAVIGCLDPHGSRWRTLADWCMLRGGRELCAEDAFRLWVWPRGEPEIRGIGAGRLLGALAGDLYEAPGGGSSPGPSATPMDRFAASYARYGPACLFHLNGQFSLFLWDPDRRELILFRDSSATRSLYVAEIPGGGLVFGDNLDLLVSSPLVSKQLARRSIHEFLRFLDISAPNTIYEGVSSTEPGVLYRMRSRLTREEPASVSGALDEPPANLAEAAGELERRLRDAVSVRMSREGDTVTFLSGGVDSALICALASDCGIGRVIAVTVGFEESEFDESSIARQVASHLGVTHQVLTFPMSAYREAFDELTSHIQYPSADPAGVPTLLAFRTARTIGGTALDGTGADTLLGVVPARHQRMAVQFGTLLPRPLRRATARGLKAIPGVSGYAPLVDFDDPEEVLIRWRGWSRNELEQLCGEPVSLEHTRFYQLFQRFPRNAHLDRYSALLGNLPDDRIHQATGITGLEVRFPYVDPTVSEWVTRLDPNLRHLPSEPKRVLKAVLARHIPRPLWDSPKHGFDFPFLNLMTANDCALVRTYLDPDLTAAWDFFDQQQVQAAKTALIRGERRSVFSADSPAFRTWALVVLFAWLENHFRGL